MKILFLQESDWLKRNPIIQHHLMELLSLKGHEIRVIDFELLWSQRKHGLYTRRKIFDNVSRVFSGSRVNLIRPGIINIPILDYLSVIFSHKKEIDRQIRDWSPDIIIGVAILNSYWGARAAKKAGIPFVYYWFELMHLLIPIKLFSFIGKVVEKEALKNADKVLVITDNLKKYVTDMGFDQSKVETLESGVSLDSYNSNNGDFVRQKYGIAKDDCVLFFMGWLYHFSGLKEIAAELSRCKNPKIKLIVVGEGEAFRDLQKIKNKFSIDDRLILTGQKTFAEIPQYLAAADYCIFPAYNNNVMRDIVPAKVYEYMAAGKPVISTELPGVLDKFGRNNGVIYVNKPEEVISKATELFNSPEYITLGLKARSFVERFSWYRIVNRFEMILEEAVEAKRTNKHVG